MKIKLYYAADDKGRPLAGTNREHRHHAVEALGAYILPSHWKVNAYVLEKVGEAAMQNGYSVHELEVDTEELKKG